LAKLYPEDAFLALLVDEILGAIEDVVGAIVPSLREPDEGNRVGTDDNACCQSRIAVLVIPPPLARSSWMCCCHYHQLKMRQTLATETLPKCLKILDGRLTSMGGNGSYFVGDSLTIADLTVYTTLGWVSGGVLDGIPTTILDPYPSLKAFMDHIGSHPKVADWNASHHK